MGMALESLVVGILNGSPLGDLEGSLLGSNVRNEDGIREGGLVGCANGSALGLLKGFVLGLEVGICQQHCLQSKNFACPVERSLARRMSRTRDLG